MILAAGLSPAWQQILLMPGLRLGEVNRAAEAHWCGSGKVLNVGIALHYLGADVRVLAPLGGLPGHGIREEFTAARIPATWIDTQAPTRVCTTLLDSISGQTTELVENARPLRLEELNAFRDAFRELARAAEFIVVSGSLPLGVNADFWQPLLAGHASKCILDIRGPDLLAVLPLGPLLVKPNREELGKTLGRTLSSEQDVIASMRHVQDAGSTHVLVTDGKRPALLQHTDLLFSITPPAVAVVNPIGCGDCLAAGIAWGLSEGHAIGESVLLGMAAAADNVRQLLPARLDPERVRNLCRNAPILLTGHDAVL